jgi:hypothetical protein
MCRDELRCQTPASFHEPWIFMLVLRRSDEAEKCRVTFSIFSPFFAFQALIGHKASNRGQRVTFSCRKLKFELLLLYF